jgi:hypothetical protein
VGFDWLALFDPRARARFDISRGDANERIVRVDKLQIDVPANWKIQYQVVGVPVIAGRKYQVKCVARSDRPKMIPVVIQKERNSGEIISDFQGLEALVEWKEHELIFTSTADVAAPIICFTLGQETTPAEFQKVVMEPIDLNG